MKEPTHAIIIRLYYEPEDPRFDWRFSFFASTVLPRLLAQKDQNFDLWIRCNPAHTDLFEGLSPKIKTFQGYRQVEDRYFKSEALTSKPMPRYNIQTRIDSDDWVTPEFTAKVRETVKMHAEGKPLVVSFMPLKFDLWSVKLYKKTKNRYHSRSCSQFLSLYQPDLGDGYRVVYEFNHRLIWEAFPRVVMVEEGFCYLVVHGKGTEWNRIDKGDIQI